MTYQYPEIGATIPEQTEPVPALTYDFWVISRIANFVSQVIDRDPTAGVQLEPVGNLTIQGRKYTAEGQAINPTGETTAITVEQLWDFFSNNPEFATAYNAFATACGILLDLVDTETLARTTTEPASFEEALRQLREAYQAMDRDDDAGIVTECIRRFPADWDRERCLAALLVAFRHTQPNFEGEP